MRYLGAVGEELKGKNFTHMKQMVEREVVVRCVKHIFNEHIRQCNSEETLGFVMAHLLNCLFAPKDFIKKMDDGHIKSEPVTIKNVADKAIID